MRPEVAHRRIEAFGKRFGEAHLYLAYHAAFPLALTPDLLYRLWANFQRDIHGEVLNIPWIAVADLLLAYVRQQLDSPDIDTRDFAQAQKWTALAYVRPNEAACDIASALKSAYQQDRAELVRMASLVETFAEPLAEFNPLLVYARGMGNLARGDWKGAAVQFDAARGQRREVRIAGVSLPIPEQILVETSQTPAPESNRSGVGSLRASKRGLEIVDRARRKKGWNKDAPAWIDATATISRSTLQRFWRQQPIRAENFLAICKAVGIDDWEKIVDNSPSQETPQDGNVGVPTYATNVVPTIPNVALKISTDNLSPDLVERCTNLRELLAAEKWQEADWETITIVLKVAEREKEGWLGVEDVRKLSCEALRTIDKLWIEYSNGRFGLSIQKRIWESLGDSNSQLGYKTWWVFGESVGWRVKDKWLAYEKLTFNLNAPEGHLPFCRAWMGMGRGQLHSQNQLKRFSSLVFRVAQCKLMFRHW